MFSNLHIYVRYVYVSFFREQESMQESLAGKEKNPCAGGGGGAGAEGERES